MDDAPKPKRRRLRSNTASQPIASTSVHSPARPKLVDDDEDVTSSSATMRNIMNRPVSFHLEYAPPSTTAVCTDSVTSIRSATVHEIMKREDVKECPVCFEDFRKHNHFFFQRQQREGVVASAAAPAMPVGTKVGAGAVGDLVATPCDHYFHRHCLLESLKYSTMCPLCRKSLAPPRGKCPPATMTVSLIDGSIYGWYAGLTANLIQITYSIPSGIQAACHEAPGQRFSGTSRVAYLQNDVESRLLLQRLCFAFMHGLTFSVGTSLTSGASNTVTWASIHHKTNIGQTSFALPDPSYVPNCNEELDNQNVPPAESCGPYF